MDGTGTRSEHAGIPWTRRVPSGNAARGRRVSLALIDFLLPRTDVGVYAQTVGAIVVYTVAFVLVRRDRELRLLVFGLATFTAAFMSLRAVH